MCISSVSCILESAILTPNGSCSRSTGPDPTSSWCWEWGRTVEAGLLTRPAWTKNKAQQLYKFMCNSCVSCINGDPIIKSEGVSYTPAPSPLVQSQLVASAQRQGWTVELGPLTSPANEAQQLYNLCVFWMCERKDGFTWSSHTHVFWYESKPNTGIPEACQEAVQTPRVRPFSIFSLPKVMGTTRMTTPMTIGVALIWHFCIILFLSKSLYIEIMNIMSFDTMTNIPANLFMTSHFQRGQRDSQ